MRMKADNPKVVAQLARDAQRATMRRGLLALDAHTPTDAKAVVAKANKYHAIPTEGKDSGREAARHGVLKTYERAGTIKNLRCQVRYEIIPKQKEERAAHYTSDYEYDVCDTGEHVVEDSKPQFLRSKTDYVLRRKLMLLVHGIRIREV